MSSPAEPRPRLRDSYRAMPRTAWVLFGGTFNGGPGTDSVDGNLGGVFNQD